MGRGKFKAWLYLFTTPALPAGEVVELCGRRWNIETDARALKRTVQFHHIAAKCEDRIEKELLAAGSACNLVDVHGSTP